MIDVGGSQQSGKGNSGKKCTVIVYPNPAADKIFVQNLGKYDTGQVIDMAGTIVQQFTMLLTDEQITIKQLNIGSII